jgi:type I restriction enzyme M protein
MQDDCYIISRDGWHVELHPTLVQKVNKKQKTVTFEPKKNPTYTDMESDLLPVSVVVNKFFAEDESHLCALQAQLEELQSQIEELEGEEDYEDTKTYKDAKKREKQLKSDIKTATKRITDNVVAKYAALTEDEICHLVVENKWLATLENRLVAEMTRVSQDITTQVLALQKRYAHTLPEIEASVAEAEDAVKEYLQQMGF